MSEDSITHWLILIWPYQLGLAAIISALVVRYGDGESDLDMAAGVIFAGFFGPLTWGVALFVVLFVAFYYGVNAVVKLLRWGRKGE